MYKWDKKHINELLKYLNDIEKNKSNSEIIEDDIDTLKFLKKSFHSKETYKDVMYEDIDNYHSLKEYIELLNTIIKKGYHLDDLYLKKYKKIKSSRKDILLFIRDNIKNIDKKWYNLLEPHFNDTRFINFHTNDNNTVFLPYLNKVFISLSKNNNIEDFIIPTHEYLHILTFLLNNNAIDTIEREAIPILGELITTYEMRNKHMFTEETIKADVNNFFITDQQLKSYPYRLDVITNDIDFKKIKKYLITKYKIKHNDIKLIYDFSLDYSCSVIISYFLAIELFEIYKQDKEKCIYICNNIILSNKDFFEKLKDNKIELTQNSEKYIKELKKNIIIK